MILIVDKHQKEMAFILSCNIWSLSVLLGCIMLDLHNNLKDTLFTKQSKNVLESLGFHHYQLLHLYSEKLNICLSKDRGTTTIMQHFLSPQPEVTARNVNLSNTYSLILWNQGLQLLHCSFLPSIAPFINPLINIKQWTTLTSRITNPT